MIGNRRMTWRISMWTQLFGVYLCLSHFKLQFILDRSLWNNYSGQLNGWSKIMWTSQIYSRLTGTSLCGENHLCCVIELFILWNQKPTYLPTRCHVWEASVLHQSKLGETWNDKIKWHLETRYFKDLDRIDGEPMEFEWTNFKGFTTLGFSTRFKRWWRK